LMQNHVYITHPVVDIYAREVGGWIASASGQIEQPRQGGNHYILWFAFIAWLDLIFSVAITKAYKSFNIIAVIRLPIRHAFFATRHPHPRQNARPLYTRISPDWSRRFV
jgi:hypothetical protein